MRKIFSLDLGNKRVKMVSEMKKKSFPAYFVETSEYGNQDVLSLLIDKDNKEGRKKDVNTYIINKSNVSYTWGKEVDTTTVSNVLDTLAFGVKRYKDKNFRNLVSMALCEMARDFKFDKQLEVNVVSGLPTDDFNTQACIDALNEALKGIHTVNINGENITVEVKETFIMAQPVGTAVDFFVGDEGEGRMDLLQSKNIAVVDNGGGTRLIDILKKAALEKNKRSQSPKGAFTLYELISNRLNSDYSDKFDIHTDVYDIEKLIRDTKENGEKGKELKYIYSPNGDDYINVSEVVNEEIDKYTEKGINDVMKTLSGFGSIFRILYTGGTSNIINREIVKEKFGKAVVFVEDSEYATAKGYLKYANLKWQ